MRAHAVLGVRQAGTVRGPQQIPLLTFLPGPRIHVLGWGPRVLQVKTPHSKVGYIFSL